MKADEEGVVMRFGKYTRTTAPGVNYHLPYPFESVETPRVTADQPCRDRLPLRRRARHRAE